MTTLSMQRKGWSRARKAGTEVWFGRTSDAIPTQPIGELVDEVFASYSGPDRGLSIVPDLPAAPIAIIENTEDKDANSNSPSHQVEPRVSSTRELDRDNAVRSMQWNIKSRKAYGISMSLYEQHPINGKISGDPIADSFGICARKNNAIMIVADGVNWGEKSRLAARCAIYGAMSYINKTLFASTRTISDTNDAFRILLKAVDNAHETIVHYGGGQTTLCMALILPIKDSKQFAVCIVNVGDSLAYVFSKYHGIREITTGSHDIQAERDIRDAGGAVGPVHGNDPELHNLTCSMTVVDPGDIVYLTSDGISDNFDPVVTKIAVASSRRHSDPQLQPLPEEGSSDANLNIPESGEQNAPTQLECKMFDGKPEMAPHERHQYCVKEMERIIHEFELFTEQPCSAQELCGALLQHVLKLTDPKRKVLENPDLYGKKMKSKDRKRRDSEIVAKLSRSPGKLDHATIIGFDVGVYHGNDDEDYEVDDVSEDEEMAEEPVSLYRISDNVLDGVVSDVVDELPSHGRNKVHDACPNNVVLSPESQKKRNSLKKIREKLKSRFKSPGRKQRGSGSDDTPSPKVLISPKAPLPEVGGSMHSSSSSASNQAPLTQNKGTNVRYNKERGRSPGRKQRSQSPEPQQSEVHNQHISSPRQVSERVSSPPGSRIRGRRELRKSNQSPTSPYGENFTNYDKENIERVRRASESSSDSSTLLESTNNGQWVIKPRLGDKPVPAPRKLRPDLKVDIGKTQASDTQQCKPAKRPNDLHIKRPNPCPQGSANQGRDHSQNLTNQRRDHSQNPTNQKVLNPNPPLHVALETSKSEVTKHVSDNTQAALYVNPDVNSHVNPYINPSRYLLNPESFGHGFFPIQQPTQQHEYPHFQYRPMQHSHPIKQGYQSSNDSWYRSDLQQGHRPPRTPSSANKPQLKPFFNKNPSPRKPDPPISPAKVGYPYYQYPAYIPQPVYHRSPSQNSYNPRQSVRKSPVNQTPVTPRQLKYPHHEPQTPQNSQFTNTNQNELQTHDFFRTNSQHKKYSPLKFDNAESPTDRSPMSYAYESAM